MRIQVLESCLDVHGSFLKHLFDRYDVSVRSATDFIDSIELLVPDVVIVDEQYNESRSTVSLSLGQELANRFHKNSVHMIVLCRNMSRENRFRLRQMGFDSILELPLNFDELDLELRSISRLRQELDLLRNTQIQEQIWHQQMEEIIQKKTFEVASARNMTVFVIAKLAESRSAGMGGHLERIRDYSDILCRELLNSHDFPEIDHRFIEDMYLASPLHDIGKIIIPDSILNKQGALTDREFEVIKRHSKVGADALQMALDAGGYCSCLSMAVDIARFHHERFDGTGYPDGLYQDEIPLSAQIVAVADVFDAMTTSRVYKNASTPQTVRKQILQAVGVHFNPVIVSAFDRKFDAFLKIHASNQDARPEILALQDRFLVNV